ncbi:MAG: flagellar hook-associated protein FlgK [Terracidiphilus sp.]
MGTINSAFSLIAQALDAEQAGLNTVANNVANANTPGYTQEVPNWQEKSPVAINGVVYGDGVGETGASSLRDRVLEQRLNQQQQLAAASGSRLTALDSMQAVFTPASGSGGSSAGNIGTDLTSFFNSFSSLEANPSSNPLRQQVLSTASTLAGDISNAAASLGAQRSALDQQAASVASQVNALTANLAQLNQQIQSTSPNGDAGTLEDQRQQDLSKLSQLIGVNEVTTENNGLSITTASGQLLVSEGQSIQLTTGAVGGTTHFFVGGTDVTAQLATGGGSLGGLLTARDQDIPGALASLDQLAYSVSTQVNTVNNAGTDLAGDNGNAGNIFAAQATVAGSALGMKVAMTDPNHIAAAGLGKGTGDNSNAVALAGLATQSTVGGQTPANYYSSFVTQLGTTVSSVETEHTAQSASVTQLQTQNSALSGVNLNDEASAMTTLERSYQAASQVFAMLNTIMASALNLGEQSTVS